MRINQVVVIKSEAEKKALVIVGGFREWPKLWETSRNSVDSAATDWLNSLSEKPEPDPALSLLEGTPRTQALAHARGVVKRLQVEGYEILNPRSWATYNGGYKGPLPVIVKLGEVRFYFPTATAAAEELGVSPKTILDRVRRGEPGYAFAKPR